MYYYIYDNFLKHKKYQSLLSKIENRLTDLGINGRIGRLSLLTSLKELIKEGIKRDVKTIVVVGNNQTINRTIKALAMIDQQLTLGIIPIGSDNQLAELLGIPTGESACEILSARKIEKLNIGQINNDQFFISSIVLSAVDIAITCDNQYRIIPTNKNGRVIINNFYHESIINNPKNDLLKIFIQGSYKDGFIKKFIKKDS